MKCHKWWSNLRLTQLFCCGIHQSSSIQVTNYVLLNNQDRLCVSHQFVFWMLQLGWKRRGMCTVVPLQRALPARWGRWSFLSLCSPGEMPGVLGSGLGSPLHKRLWHTGVHLGNIFVSLFWTHSSESWRNKSISFQLLLQGGGNPAWTSMQFSREHGPYFHNHVMRLMLEKWTAQDADQSDPVPFVSVYKLPAHTHFPDRW